MYQRSMTVVMCSQPFEGAVYVHWAIGYAHQGPIINMRVEIGSKATRYSDNIAQGRENKNNGYERRFN